MKTATTMMIVSALAMPLVFGNALAATVSHQDMKWLQGIHQGCRFVIQASKYEADHGSSPLVKKYAQKLIAQDEYVDTRAKNLAAAEHVSLPNDLTQLQQQELSKIKSKRGTELDKLYSLTLLESEIEFGNKTLKEITHGQSKDEKNFATFLLPAINLEANMFQHATSKLNAPR